MEPEGELNRVTRGFEVSLNERLIARAGFDGAPPGRVNAALIGLHPVLEYRLGEAADLLKSLIPESTTLSEGQAGTDEGARVVQIEDGPDVGMDGAGAKRFDMLADGKALGFGAVGGEPIGHAFLIVGVGIGKADGRLWDAAAPGLRGESRAEGMLVGAKALVEGVAADGLEPLAGFGAFGGQEVGGEERAEAASGAIDAEAPAGMVPLPSAQAFQRVGFPGLAMFGQLFFATAKENGEEGDGRRVVIEIGETHGVRVENVAAKGVSRQEGLVAGAGQVFEHRLAEGAAFVVKRAGLSADGQFGEEDAGAEVGLFKRFGGADIGPAPRHRLDVFSLAVGTGDGGPLPVAGEVHSPC